MDTQLARQLKAWNPWWQEGPAGIKHFGVPGFKRDLYGLISSSYMRRNQGVSIVGMRQVGKTTIMHQCIKDLLEKGVSPKHIFFVSFEDSYLQARYNPKTLFHDVITTYADAILREDIAHANAELYFFFDEIHRLPLWAQSVKTYFDQHAPIAFMVSGSASFGMQATKGDSLLGRMNEFTLYPFSFQEAVSYWEQYEGGKAKELSSRMRDILATCQSAGVEYFSQGKLALLYEAIAPAFTDASVWHGQQFREYLRRYALEGGFPRVWQQEDEYSKHRHIIEQHLQKVIREDLPQIAKIRKVSSLEALYIGLLDRAGEETVLKRLSEETAISAFTLEQYIGYLKKTFLLFPVERTKTKNILRQRRSSRVKFYPLDAAVRAAVLKNREDVFENPEEMGVYAENLVASALWRKIAGRAGNGIRYYREGNRYEVDFIIKDADSILPVEVKWRENIPSLPSLDRLCDKWGLSESVLVTRDRELTYKNGRLSIPLWFFLLLF
ncbi:ATP-binding protein [Patescibacteria group bacterium]|nr:ATP-binding protein [Patescibacteria group bacterium]